MNATQSLKSLAAKVKLICKYGARLARDKQDESKQKATGYTCTFRYQGRQYTFDFWMGEAHTKEPDAEGCLECLLSDAQSGMEDFDTFCSEMGYDEDSRKAERIWKACRKTTEGMKRLLGDDFETFLYADRN